MSSWICVDFETEQGEKRRHSASYGEYFQRSTDSKDAKYSRQFDLDKALGQTELYVSIILTLERSDYVSLFIIT